MAMPLENGLYVSRLGLAGIVKTYTKPETWYGHPAASVMKIGKLYTVLCAGKSPVAKPGYYTTQVAAEDAAKAWMAQAEADGKL